MIVAGSPKNERDVLSKFFLKVDPTQAALAEVRRGWMGWHVKNEGRWTDEIDSEKESPLAAIVIGRYRDNCYLAFLSMPEHLRATLKVAIEALLSAIYCTPLKWEPSGDILTWGDASISFLSHGPSLRRKGAWHEGMSEKDQPEWERWIHKESPNAQFTIRSTLPSLAISSIWMAASITDLRANFRSIYMGIGWHQCPATWWKGLLKRFLKINGLTLLFSFRELEAWYWEGRLLRTKQ